MTDKLEKVAEDSTRGGFFLATGTAAATVIMAIASILIARFLEPELYGQYTLALVVPSLLFLFTDLGLNQGIVRFTASLSAKGETNRIIKIIKYGILLRTIAGIIIFAINYFLSYELASLLLQRPDLGYYVQIASISILFQVIYTVATSAFVGLDKTEFNAIATNVNAIAKSIISITLVLLGFGVTGAIIGFVGGHIIATLACCLLLFIILNSFRHNNIQTQQSDTKDLKNLMVYSAPLYLSVLLMGIIPIYQNVILAFFTTNSEIGNYKAATNFIALMGVLTAPITTALLLAFSKLELKDKYRVNRFFKLANKYVTLLIIPIAILTICFSNEIVQIIYGLTYESAPIFLATYSLSYLLVGFGALVLGSLFNGLGETKITMKMNIITFTILLVLSPILTQIYKVQGTIITFLIASITSAMYALYIAKKKFQIELEIPSILRTYLVASISGILPLVIFTFLRAPSIVRFVIGSITYIITYLTLIPLTKTITTSDLKTIRKTTEKIKPLALLTKPLIKYEEVILKSKQTQ